MVVLAAPYYICISCDPHQVALWLAAQVALQRGLACSTAGGTHHAFVGHGSGYCFLNDLAVAARLLTTDGGLDRVLIVDLDVHQVSR